MKRERRFASSIQHALERLYGLDHTVDVRKFVVLADEGERERLLVRESDDGDIEMMLRIPQLARSEFDAENDRDLDPMCQIIEGVSHFIYIAHRAAIQREATRLELELQAEVDKYVVLATALRVGARKSEALRRRLFERVEFSDEASTDSGERYRVANSVADRFTRRLERHWITTGRFGELRDELRRFFRMGQEEKLRFARAA